MMKKKEQKQKLHPLFSCSRILRFFLLNFYCNRFQSMRYKQIHLYVLHKSMNICSITVLFYAFTFQDKLRIAQKIGVMPLLWNISKKEERYCHIRYKNNHGNDYTSVSLQIEKSEITWIKEKETKENKYENGKTFHGI